MFPRWSATNYYLYFTACRWNMFSSITLSILGPQILVCFSSQQFITYPKHTSAVSVHTNNSEKICFIILSSVTKKTVCLDVQTCILVHTHSYDGVLKSKKPFILWDNLISGIKEKHSYTLKKNHIPIMVFASQRDGFIHILRVRASVQRWWANKTNMLNLHNCVETLYTEVVL